ncbi:ATP-dependent helicase/nuclease subunit A [Breznakia sp. PF5-3]|uniref:UvrD-helicase domain-containing protein n=1 Tax=unclassified Breznakia TaxID=2623764 RepID=UPI002406CDA0|nr:MULTISPECIES: UvrD-helicase domain-containing protein [unclassified Breznakia]MDF9824269.1 ATP-dependent helicase/nuclease subunit A [Breznakia sp. PM6-1]MDF9835493.1 ATP-dependent helicase/nuclease subunit A [Breznakia sp. PF5-3]MDF9838033.1 ATP-dependent helicase/nuclease subunit A [Breznakia sp. PFB2-8]MDF9859411.1 ATP-dependent helicase/nuclease subunit A [Breznakia sp. PH5-24]
MVKWNEAQERAIYTKDKNILISASAGAGKTTVLIARLMHLIKDDHIGVDQILAMTFSEAAAAEMKKRLAKALHESLHENDDSTFIQKQLANLDSANISTIHGFCLTIIKEYYYMVDLDKKRIQNPMEETQASYLKNKALKKALEEAYRNPSFYSFASSFTSRPESSGSLDDELVSLANLANSKADPYAFLVACRNAYHSLSSIKDVDENILHYFIDAFRIPTNLLLDLVVKTIYDLNDDSLIEKKHNYEQAMEALNHNDYEMYRLYFMNGMKVKLPAATKSAYIAEITAKEKSILKVLFDEKTFLEQHNALVDDVHFFIDITEQYLKEYEQLKIDEGVIDFDDMEQYAIKILKADNGYVASLYREKFASIMVDEFQDSNDVQDELVKLISRSNNVFRVGDIKQSIYGFRHALPSIMRNLMIHKSEADELIFLSHNYRSTKAIVDFNNLLFERLMNLDGLTSSYLEADHVSIGSERQEQVAFPITMHVLNKKTIDPDGEYTSADLKASYLANQIQKLVKDGYKYQDIVVLVRSNAKMIEIKDALDEVNIPCFYNKKQGFYDSKSVQTVLSYLKALVNPYDDLHFVSILTSEIYQKDVTYLASARLEKQEEAFAAYLKDDQSLATFYDLKEHLYEYKLSEILTQIYDINNFYMEYTTSQEKANLDMLYEIVCDYEKQEAVSINGFLNYLSNQQDVEVGEAMPIGANDDVVRIMSIHKSKGLQFKVVFLYSSSSFSSVGSDGVMNFDEELKVSMKYLDKELLVRYPTITSIALKQKQLQEYLEEEQRLLYVATTRSQEVLHIIDVGDDSEVVEYSINEFYKLHGYTGWIRKAFALEPSPLFVYEHVNEMWENEVLEEHESTYTFHSYDRHTTSYELISPSDTELRIERPAAFSIDEDLGFERGTNLHRMVEYLPNSEWNTDIIKRVAKEQKIELNNHDQEVLQSLSNNAVFKYALSFHDIYHEYAFSVKKEQKIAHGYMDFLAVQDDRVIMVDFKSDRGVNEAVLKDRYQLQILEYREALCQLYPKKTIKTYIYSFELQTMIEV